MKCQRGKERKKWRQKSGNKRKCKKSLRTWQASISSTRSDIQWQNSLWFEISLTQSCKCKGGGRKILGQQLVVTCWTRNCLFTRLGYSVFMCGGRTAIKLGEATLRLGLLQSSKKPDQARRGKGHSTSACESPRRIETLRCQQRTDPPPRSFHW
jgi:hypothetical protein